MTDFSAGKRWRLSPSVAVSQTEESLFLCSDRVLKLKAPTGPQRAMVALLEQGGATVEALGATGATDGQVEELLELLHRLQFVVEDLPNAFAGTRLEKQVEYAQAWGLDGSAVVGALRQATVGILGVGGTGGILLQHLVAAGVGRFVLIDGDAVNANNLNRQFICRAADVGRRKVEVAREYVLSIDPEAAVTTSDRFIDSPSDVRLAFGAHALDFVVLAADLPVGKIQEWLGAYCAERRIPWLFGACGFLSASFGPLHLPGEIPRPPPEVPDGLRDFVPPQQVMRVSFGPTNTIVGACMAFDVVHYLMGLPTRSGGGEVTVRFHPRVPLAGSMPPAPNRAG